MWLMREGSLMYMHITAYELQNVHIIEDCLHVALKFCICIYMNLIRWLNDNDVGVFRC